MSAPPGPSHADSVSKTSSRFLVIKMTAIKHPPGRRPALRSCLTGTLRRAGRTIRDCHRGQAYLWECLYLANRTVVPQTGPLRWALTLDGYRLAGRHLPATAAEAGPSDRD
jgi:hypothetical protein